MKEYFLAILKPTTAELESLLSKNLIDINASDPHRKRTLLSFAATLDKIDMMEKLLAFGADVNVQDQDGLTALSYAAKNGKVKALQLLLDRKADPLIKDAFGKIAIKYAEPGSICLILLFKALNSIALEDLDPLRRKIAAKIVQAVFKSTGTGLSSLIDMAVIEEESLEASMTDSLTTLGIHGSGSIAASMFAPRRDLLRGIAVIAEEAISFGKSLAIYAANRPLNISAAGASSTSMTPVQIIEEGHQLMNSLDKYTRAHSNDDLGIQMISLAEMGILAEFLNQSSSDPVDLAEAFEKTNALFGKQIRALDAGSQVITFFRKHGIIEADEARSAHSFG